LQVRQQDSLMVRRLRDAAAANVGTLSSWRFNQENNSKSIQPTPAVSNPVHAPHNVLQSKIESQNGIP
jgi:hypothetical protein